MDPLVSPENLAALSAPLAAVPHHDVSIWGLITRADLVVKSVMFLLFMASVVSWAILCERYMFFKKIFKQLKSFEEAFWSGNSVENLYDDIKGKAEDPATKLFIACVRERDRCISDGFKAPFIIERIRAVMGLVFNRESAGLEGKIAFLATVGSVGPFLGLFGTVWGIMNSFTAIANSNNTSLTVVAPGIAEALFATALGLVAAIPAVMAYNRLNIMMGSYSSKLEAFADELEGVLSKHLIKHHQ